MIGGLCWVSALIVVCAPFTLPAQPSAAKAAGSRKGANLWVLKPVIRPEVPAGPTKSTNPIDAFIAADYQVDEIAVVRSMWCNEGNHFPAVIETTTGHRGRQFDHPTLGAWVTYALGTANKNLPTFVNIGRPSSPVQLTGGYLGATVSATPFQPGDTPIPNLYPPKTSSAKERERQMQVLQELNQEFRDHYLINTDIAARSQAYELAASK